MGYNAAEMAKADKRLRSLKIPHGLEDLGNSSTLGDPSYIPQLMSMFQEPWSDYVRAELIRAICSCSPSAKERRTAAELALKLMDRHPSDEENAFFLLWPNFVNLVDGTFFPEVGRRVLDPRFGENGAYFCLALEKMKDPKATDVLVQATGLEKIRGYAFLSLAKKDPRKALEIVSRFIQEGARDRELVRLQTKLRKKLEGFGTPAAARHRTRSPIPRGLATSSWNLDGEKIPDVLRLLGNELPGMMDNESFLEVEATIDSLGLNRRVRFHFPRSGTKKDPGLWLDILCDDEDAFILEIGSAPATMAKIEPTVSKLLEC